MISGGDKLDCFGRFRRSEVRLRTVRLSDSALTIVAVELAGRASHAIRYRSYTPLVNRLPSDRPLPMLSQIHQRKLNLNAS